MVFVSFHERHLPAVTAVAEWVAGGPRPTGFDVNSLMYE